MNNVIDDYQGSASITDSKIKALNSDYFNKYTSTNDNMKLVAYMLDTDVWSVFAGDKAEYAIGGPTIELLFKSYNAKYGTNYVAEAISNTGYQVGTNSTASNSLTLSKTDDSLYAITSRDKADGMWVATPSAYGASNVMCVTYVGIVGNNAYYSYSVSAGFCPLVRLRSDVQVKKTGDNTYEIIK